MSLQFVTPPRHETPLARIERILLEKAQCGEASSFSPELVAQSKQRVITLSDDDIKRKAERLALQCRKTARLTTDTAQAHNALLAMYGSQGFDPAALDAYDSTSLIARLSDADFWRRQLTRQQDRQQEAFAIRLGIVRRGRGLYVSDTAFQTLQARIAASIKAMAALEAINEETGETVDMLTVLKGSVANPEVRRVELMVRMRGFENAATQAGHTGTFYTLTCPSKYHRFTVERDATGKATGKPADNPNYAGATPRQAQTYLTALWARIRSKLKRDGLTAYGFRVAEPHHDGCPHWHMLLFTPPAQQAAVTAIIQHYALLEDGDEPGAAQYRFKAVAIDSSKGSATGYIAKYVSKNINGYGVDEDFESGTDAADSAQRVRAWASLWGIRQFQQIGGAPVGVWRELRRLGTAPDGLLEQARQAADAGDWGAYLALQGGVAALRKDMPLKVYTVERINTDTGEVISNKYGEIVGKVDGVALADIQQVQTRLHVWRIQPKAKQPEQETPVHYVAGFDLLQSVLSSSSSGAAATPWMSEANVNKCTATAGEVLP